MFVTTFCAWYFITKRRFYMWQRFKESRFAQKCKELSHKGGFVATVACLTLVLAIVLSASIATNRAKQQYADDTSGTSGNKTETPKETDDDTVNGTVNTPVHKDEEETPVGGEAEEFQLSLPAEGVVSKGHDATLQVWSETMGAYKVHLGIDITTDEGAPVFAAADGTVSKVWDDAMMGKCVAIDHGDGIFTFYKNLDPVLASGVEQGKTLKNGDQIGKVGESAMAELADEPHLHIEMTVNGIAVDPTDYLSQAAKDSISKAPSTDK